MQWKTIKSNSGYTVLGSYNNIPKKLTLDYKTKSDTLYFENEEGEKRHFHYRKKGIFKNKIVLENEYGVDLCTIRKEGQQEYLIVDNKRYHLQFGDAHDRVAIIDENNHESIAECVLDNPSAIDNNYSLLIIICLYTLQYNHYNSNTTGHFSFN